jgi:hypothetical protein
MAPLKIIGMLSMAALASLGLAGCTQTRYVNIPVAPPPPGGPVLQACADHAAGSQRTAFGDEFRGLQLNTQNAILAAPTQTVGNQAVAAVMDGEGLWFGRPHGTMGEWRKVRYHCLLNPAGQVVYSFIRAE